MAIKYIIGNATEPQGNGNKFIVHICNNIGAWGAGFVLALSGKWPQPEEEYKSKHSLILGNVQLVQVSTDIYVVNMIAQEGIRSKDERYPNNTIPPIRYNSLEKCLDKVKTLALVSKASIHMPRIGTGLAGGNWDIIKQIIENSLSDLDICVYDLK